MAFTVDLTTKEGVSLPWPGDKCFVMKKRVDFSVAANYLANALTMGIFDVPAGVLVREVIMKVITADADISDVQIGSYTTAGVAVSANGFHGASTIAATGYVRDVAGQTYSITDGTAGYVAVADWAIGLLNNDAQTINEAVIDFIAICEDLR